MPKESKSTTIKNIYGSETQRLVYADIAYFKKRIHLVEGERKANYESNEEQLKQNEQIIYETRQKNAQLKKENREAAKLRDNCFQEILSSLRDGKLVTLFRGKNFEESVDILECKLGDLKNKLNLLRFDKRRTGVAKKLILKTEKEIRLAINENPDNQNTSSRSLKDIENAISTMQLRSTEAENIRSRYKHMIETLVSENFAKNVRIVDMENKVQKQIKEKDTTKTILFEAVKAKKAARLKLTEVEDMTMKDYGVREQKLFLCRGSLKQIREKMEQIGTKLTYPKFHMIHRDSSLTEGLYFGVTGTTESHETKSQNVMEKVYKGLKDMTGESDPARIIARFQQQREHTKELVVKEKEVKSQVRKGKLRQRFLQDKLNNLQFCGGIQWQELDIKHQKILKETEEISSKNATAKSKINEYSAIMDQAIIKLSEICSQNGIRAPTTTPTGDVISSQYVIDILKFLISTLEQALEEQEVFQGSNLKLAMSETELSDASGFPSTTFSAFKYDSTTDLNLLNQGSAGKSPEMADLSDNEGGYVILKGKKREAALKKAKSLDKKSDSSDDTEAVTRIFIKRQAQVLVESKTRKGRFNPGMSISPRPR